MTDLLPFLQYPFMQRALIAVVTVGFLCAVMGVYVTLRSMSFFSDAISHSALAGIALGVLLGVDPVVAAVVFCVAVAAGITFLTVRTELTSDTVIGVFFQPSPIFARMRCRPRGVHSLWMRSPGPLLAVAMATSMTTLPASMSCRRCSSMLTRMRKGLFFMR